MRTWTSVQCLTTIRSCESRAARDQSWLNIPRVQYSATSSIWAPYRLLKSWECRQNGWMFGRLATASPRNDRRPPSMEEIRELSGTKTATTVPGLVPGKSSQIAEMSKLLRGLRGWGRLVGILLSRAAMAEINVSVSHLRYHDSRNPPCYEEKWYGFRSP